MRKITEHSFLLLLLLAAGSTLRAQENSEKQEPVEPVMEFTCLKDSQGKVNLNARMLNYVNRLPVPLKGLKIDFYAGEDSLLSLGSIRTDFDGRARLVLESTEGLPVGPDGVRYTAEFTGSGDTLPTDYDLYIMDVNLDMDLRLIDSVKTITLSAWTMNEGEKQPVAGEDVYVYVARMFRDLPLAEDFLDENGVFTLEVPDDIPGDPDGFIEIIGKFNEHYLYGTVENRQVVQWGVPTYYDTVVAERTLWTQIAPVWMIVTLTVLLTGVWSHYIFVIISLVRIQRSSRKDKEVNSV